MTKHLLLALALVGVAVFGTSASEIEAQSGTGRVRVMHASPDTPPVDIFVDGQKAVSALAFPNATQYVSLPAGPHEVKVFVSPSDGGGAPALQATLTIEAGKDYTVLAVGRSGDGSLSLLPLTDNNATPAAGKAHVRFIHASPDAPAVDIVVRGTNTALFSNVAFKEVGAYTPVDAGAYNLDVRVSGTDAVALSLDNVRLNARTVYTVVAVGLVGESSLRAVPLVDAEAPAPPHTGTGLAPSENASNRLGLALLLVAAGASLALLSASVLHRRRDHGSAEA
ncbi:hypothetical protein HRbin29_00554 [bacterium HR29]|jgi:hypothetical protein|nr:hypothetical protein HRbin29_00554 [bacterium HR29]